MLVGNKTTADPTALTHLHHLQHQCSTVCWIKGLLRRSSAVVGRSKLLRLLSLLPLLLLLPLSPSLLSLKLCILLMLLVSVALRLQGSS